MSLLTMDPSISSSSLSSLDLHLGADGLIASLPGGCIRTLWIRASTCHSAQLEADWQLPLLSVCLEPAMQSTTP